MSKKNNKKRKNSGESPGRKTISAGQIKESVLHLFRQQSGKPWSIRQMIQTLGVRDKKSKNLVSEVAFRLEDEGIISRNRDGRFVSQQMPSALVGVVDHVNSRFAYIICAELDDDVYVKTDDLEFAVDGDTVKFELSGKFHGKKHREGRVTEIVQRKKDEFVGKLQLSKRFAFVIPDNRKIHNDIFVYPEHINNATTNDKVIVKIDRWHDRTNKSPVGKVVRVLGKAGENEAEIHSIMAEFDLPFTFPEEVISESDKISETIPEKEIAARKDFRGVTTFTIDPEDAKDFDDALSIKFLENGNYEIGVHIADVTHYVKEETILEKEAYTRATSVYLVDRTVPMLPEKLSNALCSLRPNEDKLTFSAVFEMENSGKIVNEWFGRTVIHSDRRFSYEEAQAVIEAGVGDYCKELKIFNDLAKLLKNKRYKNGAINFETIEVKFKLDEQGKPLGIVPKIRKDAHKLIEEFMLLANKRVAEFIFGQKTESGRKTFVYRTHDSPNEEKLHNFTLFAKKFGHKIDLTDENLSSTLNKLIDEIEGKPEQNVLTSLAIRSMAKAKYTTAANGHFGLAFPHYSHFTSPIRRYPDMMVHRLLAHYLKGGKSVEQDKYEPMCVHSSDMEKRAADAERASIKYKQVEFMSMAADKVFDGIVAGVTEWGIYVEIIETKCEGMVRLADLNDDFYEFDEQNYRIIGRNNKRMITLGDEVKVKVTNTDIDRRTIDLEFANEK
ncbi:MAG: ribonuclease R [Imperialibacter sp.]|uniref:ribonuclease R n=1 Tax=Imperialibacter sp. TaxID=2038411 RepID=UPI0032EFCF52